MNLEHVSPARLKGLEISRRPANAAAEEAKEEIAKSLKGAHMAFIAAGTPEIAARAIEDVIQMQSPTGLEGIAHYAIIAGRARQMLTAARVRAASRISNGLRGANEKALATTRKGASR